MSHAIWGKKYTLGFVLSSMELGLDVLNYNRLLRRTNTIRVYQGNN